jgi:uncharacterized protein (DUF697 family)/predicted GTPase
MFEKLKQVFSTRARDDQLQERLEELRRQTPMPVFWLFGKTQSGKTSIIKYLTGADDAEIGQGFRPCTRFSRQYQFPTPEAPLLTFLDTRGMDEPGYDAEEDIARFNALAHVVLVTVKVLDHALENLLDNLRKIRQSQPTRPVILALTCLHEAYPQQQHPQPYPFGPDGEMRRKENQTEGQGQAGDEQAAEAVPEALLTSIAEQNRRFTGLVDQIVPIDLTPPIEGYHDPNYGGELLKQTLLDALPAAYRQTMITLDEATHELQDLYARHALPHIMGYASLAATAGALPVPWLDLLIIPGIQTRMIYHLARFYGQPMTANRFLELAGSMGAGVLMRQAVREVVKFIPYVGSVAGSALAGASTFALGKAFCYYYSAVHKGHVPNPEDLRRYYQEQLAVAEKHWAEMRKQQKQAAAGGDGQGDKVTG